MHSFLSLSEEAGGVGCCMPSTEGCQRLQAALSRMRQDIHHAACLQPYVGENSWEKLKHRICASACKISRAAGSFFKDSLRQSWPGKSAWLRDWGKTVFVSCVPASGFAVCSGCLRARTRNQTPLTAALGETTGKGSTQDHAECPLLCHVQTYSCLGDWSLGFMGGRWQPGK